MPMLLCAADLRVSLCICRAPALRLLTRLIPWKYFVGSSSNSRPFARPFSSSTVDLANLRAGWHIFLARPMQSQPKHMSCAWGVNDLLGVGTMPGRSPRTCQVYAFLYAQQSFRIARAQCMAAKSQSEWLNFSAMYVERCKIPCKPVFT